MKKRLTKSSTNKQLSGVLAGIATYFELDVTLVRIGYAALSLFSAGFPGLLLYIVMALIMPKDNECLPPNNEEYQK